MAKATVQIIARRFTFNGLPISTEVMLKLHSAGCSFNKVGELAQVEMPCGAPVELRGSKAQIRAAADALAAAELANVTGEFWMLAPAITWK